MQKPIGVVVGAFLLFSAHRSETWGGIQYAVTDISSGNSIARDINAEGQVVGISNNHAFLYSNGMMSDLGTLGGSYSTAYGINDNGQVVGYSSRTNNFLYHAFLYTNGTLTNFSPFDSGSSSSSAVAINNSGQVVGTSQPSIYGAGHAVIYSDGTVTDLGPRTANNINENGDVVGIDGNGLAFLYSKGELTSLGSLPGFTQSTAHAINAGGQVVGAVYTSNSSTAEAFLYDHGAMTGLGTLPGFTQRSSALDVNDNGQVVGNAESISGVYHSFLYSGGVMTDLNSLIAPGSGWTLIQANAINNMGQIAGSGYDPAGQLHALLLTPIPEPSSFILLAIGAATLLAYAWRRRWVT